MAIYKNRANSITVLAIDTGSSNAAKTGESLNITCTLVKDSGTAAATTDTNPTELNSSSMPGLYQFDLTATECDADTLILTPTCSTADIELDPIVIYTTEQPLTHIADPGGRKAEVDNLITNTGNTSGATSSLNYRDGVYVQLTDNGAGLMDIEMEFQTATGDDGENHVVTGLVLHGRLSSANDVVAVEAYSFPQGAYVTVLKIEGGLNTVENDRLYTIPLGHEFTAGSSVGLSTNGRTTPSGGTGTRGSCYIRFVNSGTLTSSTLFIQQLYATYEAESSSAGEVVTAMTASASTFQADVSTLATSSALTAIDNKIDTIDASCDAILIDTNELQTNQGQWLTATGFSTHTAADVYTQFTTSTNADAFKANVASLATSVEVTSLNDFDPANDVVANVSLVDTTTNLTNGGGDATAASQTALQTTVDNIQSKLVRRK